MLRVLKWVCVPILAVALVGVAAPQAEAGNGFRLRIGAGGYGHSHYGHRIQPYRIGNLRSYSPGYNSYYRGYNNRPHLHYHAPSLVPHRGHYHYQPGHFDLHYGRHYPY